MTTLFTKTILPVIAKTELAGSETTTKVSLAKGAAGTANVVVGNMLGRTARSSQSHRSVLVVVFLGLIVYVVLVGWRGERSGSKVRGGRDGPSGTSRGSVRPEDGRSDNSSSGKSRHDRPIRDKPRSDPREERNTERRREPPMTPKTPQRQSKPNYPNKDMQPRRRASIGGRADDPTAYHDATSARWTKGAKGRFKEGSIVSDLAEYTDEEPATTLHRDANFDRNGRPPRAAASDPKEGFVVTAETFSATTYKHNVDEDLLMWLVDAEKKASDPPEQHTEIWHQHYGPLPGFAFDATKHIASYLDDKHIETLRDLVNLVAGRKTARNWTSFLERMGKEKVTAQDITLGWFVDSFRLVPSRVSIIQKHKDQFQKLGRFRTLLGWLEHLAALAARSRLFSEAGHDLHGLGMRLNYHAATRRLTLTVWVWGGPIPNGETSAAHWGKRYFNSASSFSLAYTYVLSLDPYILNRDPKSIQHPIDHRAIIFRPGWTVNGVKVNDKAAPGKRLPEDRSAKVITLSGRNENTMATKLDEHCNYLDRALVQVFSAMHPTEIHFLSCRQFHWAESNATKVTLTDAQIGSLLFLSSIRQLQRPDPEQYEIAPVTDNIRYMTLLDLGGYVPMFPATAQKESARLFSLRYWPQLRAVVLPYIPLGDGKTPDAATARLLTDPHAGLLQSLVSRNARDDEQKKVTTAVKVYLVMPPESTQLKLVEEIQSELLKLVEDTVNTNKDVDPKSDMAKRLAILRDNIWFCQRSSGRFELDENEMEKLVISLDGH